MAQKKTNPQFTLRRCAVCEGVYELAKVKTPVKIDNKRGYACDFCVDDLNRERTTLNEVPFTDDLEDEQLLEEVL